MSKILKCLLCLIFTAVVCTPAALGLAETLNDATLSPFFLGMVKPPQRVQPAEIPPREYIFVVDVSRSMNGFPLNTAKKLLRNHSEKGVRAIMRLPLNKSGENR